MIFEIRNYHYEPTLMPAYKEWAQQRALPYLREHLDLVGFWVNLDEPVQVDGKPLDELSSATVTWILRWDDLAVRNAAMDKLMDAPEWQAIMKTNPGLENYHRTEVKFAEEL